MLALRNLTRAAPRSAARLSKAVSEQPSLLRQTAAFRRTWAQAPRLAASFHLSAVRSEASAVNEELVAKLQSEITMEEDIKEDEDLSANIKEFLESSAFEIQDTPGNQEVVLTRTFGDENIRITFTTADLDNEMPEQDVIEDNAMTQDGNVRIAPEEQGEEEFEEENQQGFPAHASIRIERPGKGALAIEASAQDGDFLIEDLYYFKDADLADPATAEKDWARRSLYTGPPFNNLDEDLQILLEKYLEERGINTRLALFIPDYIDHKEQKEYVRWLNNVKSFVQ